LYFMVDNRISQLEKNTTASFAYVKKDILMLNDAFSDLVDRVQALSDKVEELEKKKVKKVAKKSKKKAVKRGK
jgi:hypothetical protein